MSAVYQIIARRSGSSARSIALAGKPLHFGSGTQTDLVLAGADIPSVAGRLFIGGGDQVILFNLGANLTLDGMSVPPFEPTIWKAGGQLKLGVYSLELAAVTSASPKMNNDETPLEQQALAADPPTIQRSFKIEARQPAPSPVVPELPPEIQSYTGRRLPVLPIPRPAVQSADENAETLMVPVDGTPTVTPEIKSVVKNGNGQWAGLSNGHWVTQVAPAILEKDVPEDREGFTQVKYWLEQDKLSAQLGLKAINFAPGERVVLPLSIRNAYSHPLELMPSISGLPADWSIVDAPILDLAAGELKGFEVVMNTHDPGDLKPIEAVLKLSDRVTPEINIHLPLPITLKSQSDVTGGFDQQHARVPGQIYLTLQNHTLSTIKVAMSIGQHDPLLQVVLPNPEVELIPHQKVCVPVNVDAIRRPRFVGCQTDLHISAQQGSRAPLDLATTVSIQPSIRYLPFLVLISGLIGLGILMLVARMSGVAVIAPTATETSTLPPTLTVTHQPSATAMPTATSTPTAIPTATALPFVDPRSVNCQASVSIPDGWMPYQIRRGENLFRLAQRFSTSQDQLAAVNCIQDMTFIREGQWILIPPLPPQRTDTTLGNA